MDADGGQSLHRGCLAETILPNLRSARAAAELSARHRRELSIIYGCLRVLMMGLNASPKIWALARRVNHFCSVSYLPSRCDRSRRGSSEGSPQRQPLASSRVSPRVRLVTDGFPAT